MKIGHAKGPLGSCGAIVPIGASRPLSGIGPICGIRAMGSIGGILVLLVLVVWQWSY